MKDTTRIRLRIVEIENCNLTRRAYTPFDSDCWHINKTQ